MSATSFDELRGHIGHSLVCVGYGAKSKTKPYEMVNVAIECEDCNEVLLSYDANGEVKK